MKLNIKILLAFLFISLIPLAATSVTSYLITERALTDQVLNNLQNIATIQKNRVEGIVEQNLERLALVSSNTKLCSSLNNYLKRTNTADQEWMYKILLDTRSSIGSFKDIYILALDGKVIISTDMEKFGADYHDKTFFIRGYQRESADLFFLDKDQNLRVYLSGPLYLENILLGVLVIESDVDNIISLVKDYSGLGKTGETLLARRDKKGNALFLTPLRFDQSAALRRSMPRDNRNTPVIQAVSKNRRLFTEAVDYRGEKVLAAAEYIERTGWGLVVKIDTKEAFEPVNDLRNIAVIIGMFVLLFVIGTALVISKSISGPILALEKGTEIIGSGNLDYKVATDARDEIGRLSRAFDEMTEKLKTTTVSRDELLKEVAERKRAEEKLQKANEELKKVDQLKSEFVSTVSHELRTPLSITKEGLSLVLDNIPGKINEKQQKILSAAKDNIDRLARIINSLLDISKIESGRMELKRELVSIKSLIEQVVSSFEAKAKEKGVELRVRISKVQIDVYVDADRIIQVFTNLVSNALKFTDKGYIEISAEEKEDEVECSVSDTGIGISTENIPKIFNKFQQFSRTAGAGEKGTGLGLSIAKGIVQIHNGIIWVDSKPGKGTTFSFTLPRYTAMELFKEYVKNGVKEAMEKGSKVSLIVMSVAEFDRLARELSRDRMHSILEEMEGVIKNSLRRAGDVVLKDTGEIVVVLAGTNKEDAIGIEGKLRKELEDYLKQKKLSDRIKLRLGCATYPDEAQSSEQLIKKAKKA